MITEHSYNENSSEIVTNNNFNEAFVNVKFDLRLSDDRRVPALFDDNTFISSQFQVLTSLILCIVGSIAGLLHIGLLIRRYLHTKSFSHQIFIQSLFDSCHLINILFTHMIVIIVHIKSSTNFDLHCPLSTFVFSLASFGSIILLCLGAFNRYKYFFRKRGQYRHRRFRFLAHRVILFTAISWLILNFPKFDLNQYF